MGREEFTGAPGHEEAARQALPSIKKMDLKLAATLEANSNLGREKQASANTPTTKPVVPTTPKKEPRLRGKYRDWKMAQANDDF